MHSLDAITDQRETSGSPYENQWTCAKPAAAARHGSGVAGPGRNRHEAGMTSSTSVDDATTVLATKVSRHPSSNLDRSTSLSSPHAACRARRQAVAPHAKLAGCQENRQRGQTGGLEARPGSTATRAGRTRAGQAWSGQSRQVQGSQLSQSSLLLLKQVPLEYKRLDKLPSALSPAPAFPLLLIIKQLQTL